MDAECLCEDCMQKRRQARERRLACSSGAQNEDVYRRIEEAMHGKDECGMLAEVAELSAAFGRECLNMQDIDSGDTLLHRAARKNKALACAVLLLSGADMRVCDDSGRTACHVAAACGCIEALSVLCLIRAAGSQPSACVGSVRDGGDMTPVEAAVWNQRSVAAVALCQLLGSEACQLHTPDRGGRTPLGMAIAEKDWNMAGTLLWACKAKASGLPRDHSLSLRLHCKVLQRSQPDVAFSCEVLAEQVGKLCTQYACWARSMAAAAVANVESGEAHAPGLVRSVKECAESSPRPLPCGISILECVRILGSGGMQGAGALVSSVPGGLATLAFVAADAYASVHGCAHCTRFHRWSAAATRRGAHDAVIEEAGEGTDTAGSTTDSDNSPGSGDTTAHGDACISDLGPKARRCFPLLLTDEMWEGLVHGTGVYACAFTSAAAHSTGHAHQQGYSSTKRPSAAAAGPGSQQSVDLDALAAAIEGPEEAEGTEASSGKQTGRQGGTAHAQGTKKGKKSHRVRDRALKQSRVVTLPHTESTEEQSSMSAGMAGRQTEETARTSVDVADRRLSESLSDPFDAGDWNEVSKDSRRKTDAHACRSMPVFKPRQSDSVVPVRQQLPGKQGQTAATSKSRPAAQQTSKPLQPVEAASSMAPWAARKPLMKGPPRVVRGAPLAYDEHTDRLYVRNTTSQVTKSL